MTGLPVDHRFENHKVAYKSALVVEKYGNCRGEILIIRPGGWNGDGGCVGREDGQGFPGAVALVHLNFDGARYRGAVTP